jgi:hypothetical protein
MWIVWDTSVKAPVTTPVFLVQIQTRSRRVPNDPRLRLSRAEASRCHTAMCVDSVDPLHSMDSVGH